ncbi:MAG: Re/Si-specific NAD(P)(+) transhydrogenase subunit alpha [Gammaproteobacteria bacterium]|nr:Re/Si-specific NAD(P)(+) transhydrogenase subunit alpha [Gammaproteobacteria bacterium]NIR82676.1 Re/Si-specific NAD(P)(+) transhydrogenase subunit alpha [Gammaproteobacteria bacterium]NIR89383.1 Re/Si-specific NAD(P)(+) transhydrogenase subunit alpha [Gammaproteobacteria bacterium]NIU03824.1 Re/Si-specific NAD(P)(+) transhydrogenase subunit alpha [Gammaproteobacteria bacterium]NIV51158.1 Re/Si-specific NAD(P)(+) transhydrogenase subunit alpha [Gammaproteobacteria bacterium]
MRVGVPKERWEGETRVAATPESVKKLVALGLEVAVESGAGARAYFHDEAYREAGASIGAGEEEVLRDADMVFKVRRPHADEVELMKRGGVLIGLLSPHGDLESARRYAEQGVVAFALEFMPRISRAQSMDALSSQANLGGYKAVVDAAALFMRAVPMMMTAAGTIAAARVFVMGAGVAGLQAIATAKRLGAIVSATDVRLAAKEQVESLGAKFVMVEDEEATQAETAAGYAREMSEEYRRRQEELVAETIKKQDIVVCTALVPGRPAPRLVSEQMVRSMKPGSIIVDLAIEQGGNCELARADEIVDVDGVKIMAHTNLPGHLPVDASSLYAKNIVNFVTPLVDKESGELRIDWDDEVLAGTALTRDGQVVHPALTEQS